MKQFFTSVLKISNHRCSSKQNWGPFHKSLYERFLLYEFVELVLNYRPNEFVAFTNLCETGPCNKPVWYVCLHNYYQETWYENITKLITLQKSYI